MSNDRYVSRWSGKQIDKAFETIKNISASDNNKLVYIDSFGKLAASIFTKEEVALKSPLWSNGEAENFIIKGVDGTVSVSSYNQYSFIRKPLSATEGNLMSFGGEPYLAQDSGISINSLRALTADVQTLAGKDILSGSLDMTYPKKIVLTKENGDTIDININALTSDLQPLITSSNKLSADLLQNGTTNVVLTRGEQTIEGSKTFTSPATFNFGDSDYVNLQKNAYYFSHTNGSNASHVDIQKGELEISYVNESHSGQKVSIGVDSSDQSFSVLNENTSYSNSYTATPSAKTLELSGIDSFVREQSSANNYLVYVRHNTYDRDFKININKSIGIDIIAERFKDIINGESNHHTESSLHLGGHAATIVVSDSTRGENSGIEMWHDSIKLSSSNTTSSKQVVVTERNNSLKVEVKENGSTEKTVSITKLGAFINNKQVAVVDDITSAISQELNDLRREYAARFETVTLTTNKILAINDPAFKASAKGIVLVEDASNYKLYHEQATNGGVVKSKGFELVSNASDVTFKNTDDNTLISLGQVARMGDSTNGVSYTPSSSTVGLSGSALSGIFGTSSISFDSSLLNVQMGGKTKISADSSSIYLNNDISFNSRLSLESNAAILTYGSQTRNFLKLNSNGAEISLGGNTDQKIKFSRGTENAEIIIDDTYKVITEKDIGYLVLTGTSGSLNSAQMAEKDKKYCVIEIGGRCYVKCTTGTFYSFQTPYDFRNNVTIDGRTYYYNSQRWVIECVTINDSSWSLSTRTLDMMSFNQTKMLIDNSTSSLVAGLVNRIQTLENTVSSLADRVSALESASSSYARIRYTEE